MSPQLTAIKKKLQKQSINADKAVLQRFFKTGAGQYGEGDVFIGIRVPALRLLSREFRDLPLRDAVKLLHSTIHEERLLALLIMVLQMKRADEPTKKQLFKTYLANTKFVNNWDLVDLSCRDIVGAYLSDKPRDILYKLAESDLLWDRRIAMVSTWYFIREGDVADTFRLATKLNGDRQDLIHKAVGWMLREAGKKDERQLRVYLDEHGTRLPRTALRYAIERFDEPTRQAYLRRGRMAP